MNKYDEQKQEKLSKMPEKKTEEAFKNGEKQEVFILQNNIQLILTSYNN